MYHVKVLKAADAEAAGRLAADQLQQAVCAKPACVLGLATDATPIPLYRELIRREQAGLMDFSRVRSVNLDEYTGLAPDHPQCYRRFMQENLFDHISIRCGSATTATSASSSPASISLPVPTRWR